LKILNITNKDKAMKKALAAVAAALTFAVAAPAQAVTFVSADGTARPLIPMLRLANASQSGLRVGCTTRITDCCEVTTMRL